MSAIAPDLVVRNARIRTLDSGQPVAEALAVHGDRLLAVGRADAPLAAPGAGTRELDAGGRTVLPGFNDAHVHFMMGGYDLSGVQLRDAASPEVFARRIGEIARALAPGAWITGGYWDHQSWPGAPLPCRGWIDALTPDTPVLVSRLDGHMALANGVALRLAGITRGTPDPEGGVIVRDPATGEATGLLKDAAILPVRRLVPPPAWEQRLAAARAATRHAASLGVTSVQDVLAGPDTAVYQSLLERGDLLTRIYAMTPMPQWEALRNAGLRAGFGNPMLRVGAVKAFSDGSLGSGSAWFFEPYTDEPGNCGLPADEMYPEGELLRRVAAADRAGIQTVIHAIGDRANDAILSLYETVARENGPRDRRWRIEHAQHLRREDLARFGAAGVIASVQPYHCADDGRWAERRIGVARAKTTFAFRSLLEAGATLALGTDWTVAPLDPFPTLAAAVTRRPLDGSRPGGWVPEEKLTLEQALRAYVVGSAYAEFQDHLKGALMPGRLADFVLVDRDPFDLDPASLGSVKVLVTVVGGRVVYEAPAAAWA